MAYTGAVPDTAVRRLDWMEQMACRDVDPELFEDEDQEHEARTICIARCPVRSQCLAHVKTMERGKHRDQRDGVVAGLTYTERHRLDAAAPRHQGDAALLKFDGTERCGTHLALLRHLWLDEPIDSKCWSGKVKRDRKNRGAAAPEGGESTSASGAAPARAQQPQQPKALSHWTTQERRIHALWASGVSDVDIARCMAISAPAVQRVRERLGLPSPASDIARAVS